MTIQWYPGHMAKAKRQFKEKLNLVDIVFELRDARVPASSQNPDIDEVVGNKPRLTILMKTDLADPEVTGEWISYYKKIGQPVLAINANDNNEWKKIHKAAKITLEEDNEKEKAKGCRRELSVPSW